MNVAIFNYMINLRADSGMQKSGHQAHSYNYSENKSVIQRLIDIGIPLGLFWLYFQYYNFGKITPSEMAKIIKYGCINFPECQFLSNLEE